MSRQGSRSNSFYRSPETSAVGSYQEATPFQDKVCASWTLTEGTCRHQSRCLTGWLGLGAARQNGQDVRSVPIASTVAPPPAGVVKYMPIERSVPPTSPRARSRAFLTAFVTSGPCHLRMVLASFVDHVWHDSRRKVGAGIARVCRKYSFIKHLIFALLHGRPVIVVGQPENEGYTMRIHHCHVGLSEH